MNKGGKYIVFIGMILVILGVILPFYEFSYNILSYNFKFEPSLINRVEGIVILILVIFNCMFIIKDYNFLGSLNRTKVTDDEWNMLSSSYKIIFVLAIIIIGLAIEVLISNYDILKNLKIQYQYGGGFYSFWIGAIIMLISPLIIGSSYDSKTIDASQINSENKSIEVVNNSQINNVIESNEVVNTSQSIDTQNVIFCPKCGSKNNKNSNYCSNCANNLSELNINEN